MKKIKLFILSELVIVKMFISKLKVDKIGNMCIIIDSIFTNPALAG